MLPQEKCCVVLFDLKKQKNVGSFIFVRILLSLFLNNEAFLKHLCHRWQYSLHRLALPCTCYGGHTTTS